MSDWWYPGQLARQDQYGDTPPANWPEVYGGLTPDERGLQPQTATIGPAEMRSYTPTLGERLKGGLSDLFRSGGADTYNAGKLGDIAATGLSLLPPVGYSVAKSEMEHGVEGRNPTGIALGAFGAIPGAKGVMGELTSPFYSAAGRAVENAKLGKGTGEQWLGYLRNQPGVKPEELQYVFGNLPEGQLTKAQMQAHAAENAVTLGEVNKGRNASGVAGEINGVPVDEFGNAVNLKQDTKYHQWQLPGGENYRETLLTLPTVDTAKAARMSAIERELQSPSIENFDPASRTALREEYRRLADETRDSPSFKSSHWDEPNVLAHVRTNDREIPGVGKSLHVEEIQSDWHQKGRAAGYRDEQEKQLADLVSKRDALQKEMEPLSKSSNEYIDRWEKLHDLRREIDTLAGKDIGVPDAPFKSTWADVALKRQIREASEKGYDAISWTPGEAQAARYDLSKHIDDVTLHGSGSNMRLSATDKNGRKVIDMQHVTDETLADHIGKEAAEKLLSQKTPDPNNPYAARHLLNADLKIGGEGMKAFYDKMLVDKANAIGKKHGARVEQSGLPSAPSQQWSLSGNGPWVIRDARGDFVQDFNNKEKALEALRLNNEKPPEPVHVLRITPELRAAAMKGFPLFTAGGVIAGGTIGELARQDKYGRNE